MLSSYARELPQVTKILLFTLFLVIAISIPVFYSFSGVTDPFSFWHTSFLEKYVAAPSFPMHDPLYSPEYIPGAISELLVLSKITGISPEGLQFIPINGFMLPIIYLSLCKRLTKSLMLAGIATIMMMNIPTPMTFFTTWPHAFGFLLFILFVTLVIQTIRRKGSVRIVLIAVVFLSIHFYSYTAELWALSLLVITAVVTFLIVIFATQNLHEVPVNLPVVGPRNIDAVVLMGFSFMAGLLTAVFYQLIQKHNHHKIHNTLIRRLEENEEALDS